jgi:hypothetical protein
LVKDPSNGVAWRAYKAHHNARKGTATHVDVTDRLFLREGFSPTHRKEVDTKKYVLITACSLVGSFIGSLTACLIAITLVVRRQKTEPVRPQIAVEERKSATMADLNKMSKADLIAYIGVLQEGLRRLGVERPEDLVNATILDYVIPKGKIAKAVGRITGGDAVPEATAPTSTPENPETNKKPDTQSKEPKGLRGWAQRRGLIEES